MTTSERISLQEEIVLDLLREHFTEMYHLRLAFMHHMIDKDFLDTATCVLMHRLAAEPEQNFEGKQ